MPSLVEQDERFVKMSGGIECVGLSETSIVQAPGIEVGYVMMDAKKCEVDTERDSSEFDAVYYGKLLDMQDRAWGEVVFVF